MVRSTGASILLSAGPRPFSSPTPPTAGAPRRRPARPCAWMSAQYAGAPAPTPPGPSSCCRSFRPALQVAAHLQHAPIRADGDTATVGGLRHRGNFKELEHRVETASIAELFDASRERLAAKRTRTTATPPPPPPPAPPFDPELPPAEPEPGEIADGARERRRGGCVVAKFASPKLPAQPDLVGLDGGGAPAPIRFPRSRRCRRADPIGALGSDVACGSAFARAARRPRRSHPSPRAYSCPIRSARPWGSRDLGLYPSPRRRRRRRGSRPSTPVQSPPPRVRSPRDAARRLVRSGARRP